MSSLNVNDNHAANLYWKTALNNRISALPQANTFLAEDAFDSSYDVEAAAIQAALDSLQAQRNVQRAGMMERRNVRLDVTTVFPPEILSHILFYLSQSVHTSSSHFEPHKHLSWLSAAHVSRRWRAIALSTPALWCKLHLAMPADVWSTFMERARSSSLVVQGRWGYVESERRQELLSRLQRIQELDIRVSLVQELEDFVPLSLRIAHCLDTLKIHINSRPCFSPTLNTFILHRAPKLQQLTLYGAIFPWGSVIPTLKCLRMYDATLASPTPTPTETVAPFEDVVQTLTSCTNLEELVLSGSHIFWPPAHIPIPTPAPTKLESITLKCSAEQGSSLLTAFILPPACSINVAVRSSRSAAALEAIEMESDATTETALIVSTIAVHLKRPGVPRYPVMQLQYQSQCLHLRLGNTTADKDDAVRIQIPIAAGAKHDKGSIRAKTLKLARVVTVEEMRHLVLSSGLSWSRSDVTRLFHRAPIVEKLTIQSRIHNDHAPTLLHNIISPSRSFSVADLPTEVASVDFIFPALKELHLEGVNFRIKVHCNGKDMFFCDVLLDALESRREVGHGLKMLYLDRCRHVEHYDIHQLSRTVPEVRVLERRC